MHTISKIFSNISLKVKLKPPQVAFVIDDEDQSTLLNVIQYKKFDTAFKPFTQSTSKTVRSSTSKLLDVTTSVEDLMTSNSASKRSKRRLSVAERLKLQTMTSPQDPSGVGKPLQTTSEEETMMSLPVAAEGKDLTSLPVSSPSKAELKVTIKFQDMQLYLYRIISHIIVCCYTAYFLKPIIAFRILKLNYHYLWFYTQDNSAVNLRVIL